MLSRDETTGQYAYRNFDLAVFFFFLLFIGELSSCSKLQQLIMDNNQLINTKVMDTLTIQSKVLIKICADKVW